MDGQLNIPINTSPSTRRSSWRVVWILPLISIALFSAFIAFWGYTLAGSTARISDTSSDYSIRIFKTPRLQRVLLAEGGNQPVFQDAPWTWSETLQLAKDEISVNFATNNATSLIIDRDVCSHFQESTLHGYTCVVINQKSVLTKNSASIQKDKLHISLPMPWNTGIWRSNSDKKLRGMIRVTQNKILVTGIRAGIKATADFETQPIAYLPFFDESVSSNSVLSVDGTTTIQSIGALSILFNTDLSQEQLAELSKEFFGKNVLSTTALTLEDGSIIQTITTSLDSGAIEFTNDPETNDTTITNPNDILGIIHEDALGVTISNSAEMPAYKKKIIEKLLGTNRSFILQPEEFVDSFIAKGDRIELLRASNGLWNAFNKIIIKKNCIVLYW
jgi:hypothetical protein